VTYWSSYLWCHLF